MSATWTVDLGSDDIAPRCFCVTDEAVWWVSTSGVLYTWRGGNGGGDCGLTEVPDPLSLLQLDSRAQLLCLSGDQENLLLLFPTHVSLLSLRRENVPLFLQTQEEGESAEDEEVEASGSSSAAAVQVAVTVDKEHRISCCLRDVRAGAMNRNGTCAAFSASSGLYVVDTAFTATPSSSFYGEYATTAKAEEPVSLFECAQLGASTKGALFVCFSGVTQLVVLDEANHILLLHCHTTAHSDVRSPQLQLLADGHVLTRTARATALACSMVGLDSTLILVGFSNGQVRVLDGESLQSLRTLNTPSIPAATPTLRPRRSGSSSHVSRAARADSSQENAMGIAGQRSASPVCATPVLDVQVGAHLITVSTPAAVYYYSRHAFALHADYTRHFDPPLVKVDGQAARAAQDELIFRCAPRGSWGYVNVCQAELFYAPVSVNAAHGEDAQELAEELATTDVMHARDPLPATWLGAASVASSSQRKATSHGVGVAAKSSRPPPPPPAAAKRPAKGSGYGEAPWSVQQERKKKAKAAAARDRKAEEFGLPPASSATSKLPRFQYDATEGTYKFDKVDAATKALQQLHTRSVVSATFDAAGTALLTGSADGSAQHTQFPIARLKRTGDVVGRSLAAHAAAMTAVDANLSRQRPLVLTSSADGELRIWSPGTQDTPLATCSARAAEGASGNAGDGGVSCAQFFYLDKFVLSCTGDKVELRRHGASAASSSSSSCYDFIQAPLYRYSVGAGHTVTSASAVNHFASNIVLLTTSAKEVQALDVVANTVLWSNATTHTRAVYRVVVGRNSRYATAMPSSALHLFATASLDSTVALWDVRMRSPVQLYTQHTNTAIASLGMELCPGNSMLAVASHDSRVYLYDLRKGGGGVAATAGSSSGGGGAATALSVLQGFETHVTSIAWHPLLPTMALGLANGDVQMFSTQTVA